MTNDMKSAIIPKSDQLNADDLLSGPITITVTGVTIKSGQEQPVAISYEGDNGKPYKACKSMCRVMVTAWGPDSKKYVGRSMTLYCDPKVKWAGMEVGGIRISHMSDIPEQMTMALTVTRAQRKPFTVKPLVEAAQQRRQTTREWLAGVVAELECVETEAELEGILAREQVRKARATFTNGAHEQLERAIKDAQALVAAPEDHGSAEEVDPADADAA